MNQINGETIVSAQVVLKEKSTAVYERVKSFFERAGFTIGPLVANNFSVTAPSSKFASDFGIQLKSRPRGGIEFVASEGQPSLELRAEKLPAGVRDDVEAIVFTEPPDFGPFNP